MRRALTLVTLAALSGAAHADGRLQALQAAARALPDVRPAQANAAAKAALEAETPRVSAELVLSVMWGESRFEPNERVGIVCGVMQVSPAYMGLPYGKTCRLWEHDLLAATRAGVFEIEQDLDDPRVRGDMTRALLYRACGNSAFLRPGSVGACQKTAAPGWILRRMRKIEAVERGFERRADDVAAD